MSGIGDWFNRQFYFYSPWHRRRNHIRSTRVWPSPSSEAPTPESIDPLIIITVNLCIEDNAKQHHTTKFDAVRRSDNPQLVVRRGQHFRLKLTTNRPFNVDKDTISAILTLINDDKPSHGHGTLIGQVLKNNSNELGDPLEWGSAIQSVNGNFIEILIKPSVEAPIGEWQIEFDTKSYTDETSNYKYPFPIFLIFNPWCRDDQVFMPEPSELDEYVLNDTTLIWRGSYNRLRPSVWKLGQFEKDVLECSLLIISTIGKVSPAYRNDPVRIARALSAAVNSVDDDGAVLGNWTNDYSGGTAPTKWVGSVAIMQEFYKKRKPVKYGQCWTFAGILSTISRAIGIPSRIVTNYSSAHDTQASLTVDYFVDENGKVMEEMNSDSIWNYHVWNELWMDRPDIAIENYRGWQAVDATPQEQSDNMYRCGPASVYAVKLGEIKRPYDCNFLYAEVNADKVFWRYSGPAQPLKLLRKDVLGIGQLISTKAIGKWEREDITSSYKFAEKSRDERDTMLKALKQADSSFSRYYLNEDFNDIYFNFELKDDIKIGETFHVILVIKNRSEEQVYTVSGSLHVETVLYAGNQRNNVKSMQFEKEVQPNSTEKIILEATYFDYSEKLLDQAAFNIACMAMVKDTEFEYFAQDDFRVRKPDIKMSFPEGDPTSQKEIDVIIRLTNPLPIPIHKGLFTVEGPGIDGQLLFKISETPVGGTASATFKYTPPYAGRGAFAAKFSSKELDDVDGYLAFEIRPRPEDILVDNDNDTFSNEISHTNVIA